MRYLFLCFLAAFFLLPANGSDSLELNYFEFDPELKMSENCRDRQCLNGIWQFQVVPKDAERGKVPDGEWSSIRVPSYWNRPDAFSYPPEWASAVRGWYRRTIDVPAEYLEKDQVGITFGAVMAYCQLYVNGRAVPTPEVYGCLPVTIDLTEYLKPGENLIDLEVQDGTYYSEKVKENVENVMYYGGIWQDVYLWRRPALHTANTHVKTSVREMKIEADAVLANTGKEKRSFTLRQTVLSPEGETVKTLPEKSVELAPGERRKVSVSAPWPDAELWDVDQPNLYLLSTELVESGNVVDQKLTRFGFREFRIDGDRFLLNEKPVFLYGAWDNALDPLYPEVMNRTYGELQFKAMRAMNVNTLRWHSGKAFGLPLFYNLADEHGILTVAGVERNSNGYPSKNHFGDRKSLPIIGQAVLRDRNHPSIVIWSGDNEAFSFIYWEGTLRDGPPEFEQLEVYELLTDVDKTVKKYDSSRPLYYHGDYDLFGYADILNVHYPVYVVDLISGNAFFRYLRESCPDIFKRNKPIVVGEFWFVPHLREFSEKYCGDTVFDDVESAFEACARYHERLILGWREDRIAGILSFMGRFPFHHPMKVHENGEPFKLETGSMEGPYMKPDYVIRPSVNPGWDKSSKEYYPNSIFQAHAFAFQALVAYLPMPGANGIAGTEVTKETVVINDSGRNRELEAFLEVVVDGNVLSSDRKSFTVANAGVERFELTETMPAVKQITSGFTRLRLVEDGTTVSERNYPLTLYPADFVAAPKFAEKFQLFDPEGKTEAILRKIGAPFDKIDTLENLDAKRPLIIGYHAPQNLLVRSQSALDSFLDAGGRMLQMEQPSQGGRDCEVFNQACGHPALEGIPEGRIADFQGMDCYVTAGAYPKPSEGNFRILLDCDIKRTPLLESFRGNGVCVRNQMDCTEKYGIDPLATKLFHNLLRYISSPMRMEFREAFLLGDDAGSAELLKLSGLRAEPVKSVADAAPGGVLIVAENALNADNVDSLIEFARGGGNVVTLLQNDVESLKKLSEGRLEFRPVYTGENYAVFFHAAKGNPRPARVWGINNLDFMDWSLWCTWPMAVKSGDGWEAVVTLREGPNAFLHSSLYAPRPGAKKDKYNMIRAEADPQFARESVKTRGIPVLTGKVGDGSVTFLQLALSKAAEKSPEARRIAAQLLSGAGVPAATVKTAAARNMDEFIFVRLDEFATVPFRYTSETGGWSDQGAINDLAEFPVGLHYFAGIPFDVTDPDQNGGRGCVALGSTSVAKNSRHADKYPEAVRGIAVDAAIRSLHLLLGASYAKGNTVMADVVVHYADGSEEKIPLTVGKNVADWWYPVPVPEAEIGWVGKNASCTSLGVYVTEWRNPHPEKEVTSLDLVSRNDEPIPLFAGITAERSELTPTLGLNETCRFGDYAVTATRIESHGTFSSWFTIAENGKILAEDFGCREGQLREIGGLKLQITGYDNGKVKLKLSRK